MYVGRVGCSSNLQLLPVKKRKLEIASPRATSEDGAAAAIAVRARTERMDCMATILNDCWVRLG